MFYSTLGHFPGSIYEHSQHCFSFNRGGIRERFLDLYNFQLFEEPTFFFLSATQLKCSIFGTIKNSLVVSKQPAGMLPEGSCRSGTSQKKKNQCMLLSTLWFLPQSCNCFQDPPFFLLRTCIL